MAGQVIIMIISGITAVICFGLLYHYNKKDKARLSDFESKMNNRDFTKRIVVYDFFPNSVKAQVTKNWYTVGIWLDYPNKLMALRLDRNATDLIDIPFDKNKIQSVEIIEDGYSTTTGGGLGVGPIVIGGAKSKGISKGLQVRIVTGNINTGTQAYLLKLWDPQYGGTLNKSNPAYKAITECARSIVDECENIMHFQASTNNL